MPTLHDMFSESIDGRADALAGTSAPASTLDRARGARRRFAAASTGASLLAVSALGLGALTLQPWNRADEPAASTSPTSGVDGLVPPNPAAQTASVTLDPRAQSSTGNLAWVGRLGCGDTIEGPRSAADGWRLSVDASTTAEELPTLMASTTREGPAQRATVDAGRAVLTRDGVIVAVSSLSDAYGNWPSSLPTGATFQGYSAASAWDDFTWCALPSAGADVSAVVAPAGDYTMYWVSGARMSAQDEAIIELYANGYSVAPRQIEGVYDDRFYAWAPGSSDCANMEGLYGTAAQPVVQCTSDVPPGVSVDPQTGAVTLPYDPSLVGEEFAVSLVSEGFTHTLAEDLAVRDLVDGGATVDAPALSCDASAISGNVGTYFANNVVTSEVLAGSPVPLLVAPRPQSLTAQGQMTLPATASVWIGAGYAAADADGLPGDPEFVGHATITFSSQSVDFDLLAGPGEVEATLSDIAWCPGYDGTEPFATDDGTRFIVDAPAAISWRNGTAETWPRLLLVMQ